jgi:hypothetical protein
MADLETSLRALTLQNAPVAAALGPRYYMDKLPDEPTYPAPRAQTITDNPIDTHGGKAGGRATIQIDIFDDDKATANQTAELVRGWLHNYHGEIGSLYHGTIKARNMMSDWDEESRLFRRILEIEVLYFHV